MLKHLRSLLLATVISAAPALAAERSIGFAFGTVEGGAEVSGPYNPDGGSFYFESSLNAGIQYFFTIEGLAGVEGDEAAQTQFSAKIRTGVFEPITIVSITGSVSSGATAGTAGQSDSQPLTFMPFSTVSASSASLDDITASGTANVAGSVGSLSVDVWGNLLANATNGGSTFSSSTWTMVFTVDEFTTGRFSGDAVPEPSTWALFGLGAAFVGFRLMRRRQAA